MCGISGILFNNSGTLDSNIENLNNITNCLKHRGPNNTSFFSNNGIGLGHNRLSILDLSLNGNQPMKSHSGRYVLSFNGEIYNHLELREQIQNNFKFNNWKSTSDTSTLVNLFEFWSIDKILKNINGMFAFAIWDNKKNTVYLVRDRFGEKPLYYSFLNKQFFFSSELKSFFKIKNFKKNISSFSINVYNKINYIPSPYTIFEDVFKLEPATYIKVSTGLSNFTKIEKNKNINTKFFEKKRYWIKNNNLNLSKYNSINSFDDKLHHIDYCLNKSVKSQMLSDVKIGSFLSGGIDSALVTYYMQKNSKENINTFTIRMSNESYDESNNAKKVAKLLNTNHHEFKLEKNDIIKYLPNMHKIYDEPFADSSQIPTYMVSKFASKNIKVALTGDGGDELFGGYVRHIWSNKVFKIVKYFPLKFRKIISNCLLNINYKTSERLEGIINKFLKSEKKLVQMDKKLNKLGNLIISTNKTSDFYLSLISIWPDLSKNELDNSKFLLSEHEEFSPEHILDYDIDNYLHDDVLCKVDRAAMSNSLETRVPFLDLDVYNASQLFSFKEKTSHNISKFPLRKLAEKKFTKEISNLPKKGFGIPINDLMRNELKDWVQDIVHSSTAKNQDYINYEKLRYYTDQHINNGKNYAEFLWNSLILIDWIDNKIEK